MQILPAFLDRQSAGNTFLRQGDQVLYNQRIHAHRFVIAGRGEAPAIRTESNAVDGEDMAGEGEQLLAGSGIPHFRRFVIADRGETRPIGAESDIIDGGGMAGQDEQLVVPPLQRFFYGYLFDP